MWEAVPHFLWYRNFCGLQSNLSPISIALPLPPCQPNMFTDCFCQSDEQQGVPWLVLFAFLLSGVEHLFMCIPFFVNQALSAHKRELLNVFVSTEIFAAQRGSMFCWVRA